jgi:hypothetical protein
LMVTLGPPSLPDSALQARPIPDSAIIRTRARLFLTFTSTYLPG